MIKTIRRGAAALLAAIVLTGSLTGCGTWSNTKIVLTTGLTGDQLFKVGKSVCTLPEAMIYVMDFGVPNSTSENSVPHMDPPQPSARPALKD